MKIRCFCPSFTDEEFYELEAGKLKLSGKTFYTSKIPMVSHFPLNQEIKIDKMLKEIEKGGYQPIQPLFVVFEDGMFVGRVMIEIAGQGAIGDNLVTFDDLELSVKTYTGPKFLVPKVMKEFDKDLLLQEKVAANYYFWYHSCKACEKTKGNRTAILAKVLS